MKFSISSNSLLSLLQNTGKVISSKQTMPILDYFLFELSETILKVTASDLETTFISTIEVASSEEGGIVAVPSRLIQDSLKELSEQPVDIDVDKSSYEITIRWATGQLSIPGISGTGYPELPSLKEEEINRFAIEPEWLLGGITKSVFATADSDLRPTMNGVFFDVEPTSLTFVATDAHKLVKITMNKQIDVEAPCSFILPKKPAMLLKSILVKQDEDVEVSFDSKNIIFKLSSYTVVCRAIEGRYPKYSSVIPKNNTNKVTVDRITLLNAIRRVSVCSSQASNLVKLTITADNITLMAQDVNFSVSAQDTIDCKYGGSPIALGFKSTFLVEILSAISSPEIVLELADATRAGLFIPLTEEDEYEKDMLMLLMPIIS